MSKVTWSEAVMTMLSSYEMRYWLVYMFIVFVFILFDLITFYGMLLAVIASGIGGWLTAERLMREKFWELTR